MQFAASPTPLCAHAHCIVLRVLVISGRPHAIMADTANEGDSGRKRRRNNSCKPSVRYIPLTKLF